MLDINKVTPEMLDAVFTRDKVHKMADEVRVYERRHEPSIAPVPEIAVLGRLLAKNASSKDLLIEHSMAAISMLASDECKTRKDFVAIMASAMTLAVYLGYELAQKQMEVELERTVQA